MSDTPRTDAVAKEIGKLAYELKNGGVSLPHFAKLAQSQIDKCNAIERQLNAANSRITTLQTQLDQRWEMMRALEVECGTKDVAEAVKYIKRLKARVVELVNAGEALDNAIWSVQDWGGTFIGDRSSEWEKVKEWDNGEKPVNVEGEIP